MKRQEIIKDYEVNKHGIITSPGKFEGEMVYVPHLFNVIMNGEGEHQEDGSILIDLIKEDYEEFPELLGCDIAYIREDSQGFVYCEVSEESK
jgi:hypothetical protein